MKVAAFTKYGTLAASTRQRFVQYEKQFLHDNISIEIFPLLNNSYLEKKLNNKIVNKFDILYLYIKRINNFLFDRKFDIIWIHCEAFPYLPSVFERISWLSGKPIVYDYDDAIFHMYDLHSNPVIRSVLTGKTDKLVARSSLVMAGNRYLLDRAEAVGAPRVEIVPTVVDLDIYSTKRRPEADGCLRIGWIGSPSTWNDYAAPMLPALRSVAVRNGALIRAVGADVTAIPDATLEVLPWSEEAEVPLIQSMDIGIMPLDDSPWARGKCGYKLIQYMACGLPVVASPVGVNCEIVEHGVNGFLAQTEAEWVEAIETLLGNADLRHRMGAAGRKKVEQAYSLQIYGPKVAAMLMDVARSAGSQTA